MTLTRQLTDRRRFELVTFSLPAIAAGLALLLMPHRQNTALPVSNVISLPLEETAQTPAADEALQTAPFYVPLPPLPETSAENATPSPALPMPVTPEESATTAPAPPQVEVRPADEQALTMPLQKPDIAPTQAHSVVVQAGHTLWRIARETYGYGRDYPVIVDANRKAIAKPELIHPGQQLVLPDMKAN